MFNRPVQVNIKSNNGHLSMDVESQDDITLCVEFLERLFKSNNKEPIKEKKLKESHVCEIGSRTPIKR